MKSFRKYILSIIAAMCILPSCSDYLDVVPDNTVKLDDLFSNRETSYNALARVYSYIPEVYHRYYSPWLLGDEWVWRVSDGANTATLLPPMGVMMGSQNVGAPLYSLWDGTGGAKGMYDGIRAANTFLEKIHLAANFDEKERKDWIAQVKFLKAYFHYQLIEYYGPIIIMDRNLNVDEPDNVIMGRREKIDVCFNYVINLIKEAIPDLEDRTEPLNLGMIDKKIAYAILARVYLLRASPFFNGNIGYASFLDFDGQPFFPQTDAPQKWQDALTAVNEAITFCESKGAGLYVFNKSSTSTDDDDTWMLRNPVGMKLFYSNKMAPIERWNQELIWGRTFETNTAVSLQGAMSIYDNGERYINAVGISSGIDGFTAWGNEGSNPGVSSYNSLGANYEMLERFYTKNGLPINADLEFNQSLKYDLAPTPDVTVLGNEEWAGILQSNVRTSYLYLNREMRFYTNLGVTGGFWRQYVRTVPITLYANSFGGARARYADQWLSSGIAVHKLLNPETRANAGRFQNFPFPIIRMADLYLMKAECENEVNGPAAALASINIVRARAGIPDVEVVWADDTKVTSNYHNHHTTKAGMLDIILRERSIELAFEGSRFFDVRRHKLAIQEFNKPTMGWTGNAANANDFFQLSIKQVRRFQFRDNLWPIPLNDMNINPNLKQNPSW
ncbi:hypothetical protein AGMMS49982_06880 [Bacteroidia bacterium]|nr:hypothetical protein AGMMS49982_06880 [Bacteroidia bacterium]